MIAADGKSTARRLTSGAWTLPVSLPPGAPSSPLSWSPDGKRLAIVKVASPYTGDGDKAAVQIARSRLRQSAAALRAHPQRIPAPLLARRQPHRALVSARWREPQRERDLRRAGQRRRTASVTRALDRNVQRAIWMPGGKSMLVSANDGTTTGLWIQPLEGAARRIDMGKVVATAGFWLDASVGPKGEIALHRQRARAPRRALLPRVAGLCSRSASPTYNGETAALELGRVRNRAMGFRRLPHGWRGHLPARLRRRARSIRMVLYIHGGPRSASKQAFSSRAQLLAAQGWIVFEPNYRGSDNLGNTFQAAIWNDAGAGPGRDVMAGVAELEKRGFVDTAKHGGFRLVLRRLHDHVAAGQLPRPKWKAAVAGAAVTDWLDQYNYGDANVRRGSAFGGSP